MAIPSWSGPSIQAYFSEPSLSISTLAAPSSSPSLNYTLLSAIPCAVSHFLVANTSTQPALYFQFTDWKIILRLAERPLSQPLSIPPSLSRGLKPGGLFFPRNFQNDNVVVSLSNVLPSTDTSPGHGHGDLAISKSPVLSEQLESNRSWMVDRRTGEQMPHRFIFWEDLRKRYLPSKLHA